MRSDDGRVIPTFLTQALRGDDLTIYGDGSQTRAFCYVDDLIDGIETVMMTDDLNGDIVNLGSTQEISIETLGEKILEIVNTKSDLSYEPLPEDDPQRRCPDLSKAKDILDFSPSVDLHNGLDRTLDFFRTEVK